MPDFADSSLFSRSTNACVLIEASWTSSRGRQADLILLPPLQSGEGLRKFQSPARPTADGPLSPPKSPTEPKDKPMAAELAPSSPADDCTINFFVQSRTRDVFRALEDDVAVVAPFVDGRLKNLGRS